MQKVPARPSHIAAGSNPGMMLAAEVPCRGLVSRGGGGGGATHPALGPTARSTPTRPGARTGTGTTCPRCWGAAACRGPPPAHPPNTAVPPCLPAALICAYFTFRSAQGRSCGTHLPFQLGDLAFRRHDLLERRRGRCAGNGDPVLQPLLRGHRIFVRVPAGGRRAAATCPHRLPSVRWKVALQVAHASAEVISTPPPSPTRHTCGLGGCRLQTPCS